MSNSERELTTTSYAILGLLAIQPWPTYELAKQMRRSLHYVWPRAESNLYAEAKRLVEGGLAQARSEPVGRRRRTIYSITTKGRHALERWLRQPAASSRFESETLIKLLFAPFGSKDDLLANLQRFHAEAETREQELTQIFEGYLKDEDAFPERVHVNAVIYRLLWDYTQTELTWATWAINEVEQWPEVKTPTDRRGSLAILEQALATTR
jgi:PadR family transcriptional regulator AphA